MLQGGSIIHWSYYWIHPMTKIILSFQTLWLLRLPDTRMKARILHTSSLSLVLFNLFNTKWSHCFIKGVCKQFQQECVIKCRVIDHSKKFHLSEAFMFSSVILEHMFCFLLGTMQVLVKVWAHKLRQCSLPVSVACHHYFGSTWQ